MLGFARAQYASWRTVLLQVPTSLVDLLFIELMLLLSHVKQMFSQPIRLTNELCIQVTRVDFNGDSAVKS